MNNLIIFVFLLLNYNLTKEIIEIKSYDDIQQMFLQKQIVLVYFPKDELLNQKFFEAYNDNAIQNLIFTKCYDMSILSNRFQNLDESIQFVLLKNNTVIGNLNVKSGLYNQIKQSIISSYKILFSEEFLEPNMQKIQPKIIYFGQIEYEQINEIEQLSKIYQNIYVSSDQLLQKFMQLEDSNQFIYIDGSIAFNSYNNIIQLIDQYANIQKFSIDSATKFFEQLKPAMFLFINSTYVHQNAVNQFILANKFLQDFIQMIIVFIRDDSISPQQVKFYFDHQNLQFQYNSIRFAEFMGIYQADYTFLPSIRIMDPQLTRVFRYKMVQKSLQSEHIQQFYRQFEKFQLKPYKNLREEIQSKLQLQWFNHFYKVNEQIQNDVLEIMSKEELEKIIQKNKKILIVFIFNPNSNIDIKNIFFQLKPQLTKIKSIQLAQYSSNLIAGVTLWDSDQNKYPYKGQMTDESILSFISKFYEYFDEFNQYNQKTEL